MGFVRYWWLVVSRAWARSWGAVIERSIWAIIRDARKRQTEVSF